jgi:hypothetical protein
VPNLGGYDDGLMLRSMFGRLVLVLIDRDFFELPVPARGRDVCRFLYIGMSLGSFVLPRRAGTRDDLGLYSRKLLMLSAGPPRSSTMTARRTVDMRSAG